MAHREKNHREKHSSALQGHLEPLDLFIINVILVNIADLFLPLIFREWNINLGEYHDWQKPEYLPNMHLQSSDTHIQLPRLLAAVHDPAHLLLRLASLQLLTIAWSLSPPPQKDQSNKHCVDNVEDDRDEVYRYAVSLVRLRI